MKNSKKSAGKVRLVLLLAVIPATCLLVVLIFFVLVRPLFQTELVKYPATELPQVLFQPSPTVSPLPMVQSSTSAVLNIPDFKTYSLGKFFVTIHFSEFDLGTPAQIPQVTISDYRTRGSFASNCDQVSNMSSLWLNEKGPQQYSNPNISYLGWNENLVQFGSDASDIETRQEFMAQQETLKNLGNYTTTDLRSGVRSMMGKNQRNGYSIDFLRFTSCGGYWHIPTTIIPIKQNKFQSVYYVEANEGNGDPFSPPTIYLVIKQNTDWLLVRRSEPEIVSDQMKSDLSACMTKSMAASTSEKKEPDCVTAIWDQNRDVQQITRWSNRILDSIKY